MPQNPVAQVGIIVAGHTPPIEGFKRGHWGGLKAKMLASCFGQRRESLTEPGQPPLVYLASYLPCQRAESGSISSSKNYRAQLIAFALFQHLVTPE